MNDNLTKLVFSSAGWSKDQGPVELVVWRTRVMLLQEEWRERINQVGFSSAGWSEDQGSIELVVWRTRVVLLQ